MWRSGINVKGHVRTFQNGFPLYSTPCIYENTVLVNVLCCKFYTKRKPKAGLEPSLVKGVLEYLGGSKQRLAILDASKKNLDGWTDGWACDKARATNTQVTRIL